MKEKKITSKEQISKILEYFHLNLAEFSRKLDVKTDTIYSLFYEKTKDISNDLMIRIMEIYPEISPHWLITGEGNMIIGDGNISITQGDNNSNNINTNIDKLIELSTSQQRTIEKLVSLIK